jgi:hypothetical protein
MATPRQSPLATGKVRYVGEPADLLEGGCSAGPLASTRLRVWASRFVAQTASSTILPFSTRTAV